MKKELGIIHDATIKTLSINLRENPRFEVKMNIFFTYIGNYAKIELTCNHCSLFNYSNDNWSSDGIQTLIVDEKDGEYLLNFVMDAGDNLLIKCENYTMKYLDTGAIYYPKWE